MKIRLHPTMEKEPLPSPEMDSRNLTVLNISLAGSICRERKESNPCIANSDFLGHFRNISSWDHCSIFSKFTWRWKFQKCMMNSGRIRIRDKASSAPKKIENKFEISLTMHPNKSARYYLDAKTPREWENRQNERMMSRYSSI